MKNLKVIILVAFIVIVFAQPVMPALYLDQVDTGIESIFIDNCNYITINDANLLLGEAQYNGENLDNNIPLRVITNQKDYFVRWDESNIYLSTSKPSITRQIVGNSYQQRPIEAVYMTPPDYTKTILATFALHGFEDQYNNDGKILTQIAEQVIKQYSEQPELLKFARIIILPCVNPDGVYLGVSKNGFGRCNAQGIDINRDFDYNWGYINIPRFKTGEQPFATPEAQILRNLFLKEHPDVVLDFHGWLNCTYSNDPDLKYSFITNLNLGPEKKPLPGFNPMQGYFYGWVSQYSKAALIEYPYMDTSILTGQTIQVLNKIIQN
ncbi:M14 family zinc carboxypeptidase [Bacteroides sp.]|uniref:M14 family zinc carboxypeptidase n=1 Tax=Bacteroides sp. TaxID=29523 RepID=UPI00261D9BDA|nr:M14 family zinc carboxypeptidase [Bacteroides sp.]MDD3040451.1 M14 family zinc carboxypeptidase [Bacteroides sp.]